MSTIEIIEVKTRSDSLNTNQIMKKTVQYIMKLYSRPLMVKTSTIKKKKLQ